VQGELYIGGAGLARGYQGRGALTAERFVPDGVSGKRGARLYRTGDQGRYRWDGELEYLGRADGQVKVRGNRIELAEIEAALTKHPKVQHCIVLVKEDLHGDKRLNAYVVAVQGKEGPTTSDLREHLGTCVPPYMIPSVFVMLNVMPLLPNGKVDRNALLAIEPASSVSEKNLVAARNE
jgi:acyl-coenzyme A synthetase/AMP-(fatty) acid ligase